MYYATERQILDPHCGTQHDRDVNAAINVRNMAVSSTVTACGEEGSVHSQCAETCLDEAASLLRFV